MFQPVGCIFYVEKWVIWSNANRYILDHFGGYGEIGDTKFKKGKYINAPIGIIKLFMFLGLADNGRVIMVVNKEEYHAYFKKYI